MRTGDLGPPFAFELFVGVNTQIHMFTCLYDTNKIIKHPLAPSLTT